MIYTMNPLDIFGWGMLIGGLAGLTLGVAITIWLS